VAFLGAVTLAVGMAGGSFLTALQTGEPVFYTTAAKSAANSACLTVHSFKKRAHRWGAVYVEVKLQVWGIYMEQTSSPRWRTLEVPSISASRLLGAGLASVLTHGHGTRRRTHRSWPR
jgi:hypothetical protein